MRNQENERAETNSLQTPEPNLHYRNKVEINYQEQSIEIGFLWIKKGDKLELVDDDNFVEVDFDLDLFEPEINL